LSALKNGLFHESSIPVSEIDAESYLPSSNVSFVVCSSLHIQSTQSASFSFVSCGGDTNH
jgi:hypothetical protein